MCLEIYIKHADEFNNSYTTKWRQKDAAGDKGREGKDYIF